MNGKTSVASVVAATILLLTGEMTHADVFNMPTGLKSLDLVTVGNSGNIGEQSRLPGDTTYYGAVPHTYRIGKYEVTAGQYTEFLNAVAGVDAYALYRTEMWSSTYACKIERYAGSGTPESPYRYRVDTGYENRPVNYVSWGDAARFANWLHNGQPTGLQSLSTTEDGAYFVNGAITHAELMAVSREADWKWAVPSENEWYKAAYYDPGKQGGAGYWDYPTGSDTAPTFEVPPGTDTTKGSANYSYAVSNTTDVGAYKFKPSKSPYGTFDQAGNVWEWNDTVITSGGFEYRGVRGGGFRDFSGNLLASFRYTASPTWESYEYGFRVANVPEPGSITLLLAGLLGFLAVAMCRRR